MSSPDAKKKFKLFDIILSIITGGLWLVVWILINGSVTAKRNLKYVLIGFVGLLIIGFIIEQLKSPEQKAKEQAERDKRDSIKMVEESLANANSDKISATFFAENYIKTKLKSPASADFCSMGDYKIGNPSVGEWRIIGWVDSQNSFGAVIRTRFAITMKFNGGDDNNGENWSILNYEVLE